MNGTELKILARSILAGLACTAAGSAPAHVDSMPASGQGISITHTSVSYDGKPVAGSDGAESLCFLLQDSNARYTPAQHASPPDLTRIVDTVLTSSVAGYVPAEYVATNESLSAIEAKDNT